MLYWNVSLSISALGRTFTFFKISTYRLLKSLINKLYSHKVHYEVLLFFLQRRYITTNLIILFYIVPYGILYKLALYSTIISTLLVLFTKASSVNEVCVVSAIWFRILRNWICCFVLWTFVDNLLVALSDPSQHDNQY